MAILRLLGVCPVIVPMRADEALPHLVRVVPLQPVHLAKIARRCSDDPLPAPWPGGQRAKICGLKYFPRNDISSELLNSPPPPPPKGSPEFALDVRLQ